MYSKRKTILFIKSFFLIRLLTFPEDTEGKFLHIAIIRESFETA